MLAQGVYFPGSTASLLDAQEREICRWTKAMNTARRAEPWRWIGATLIVVPSAAGFFVLVDIAVVCVFVAGVASLHAVLLTSCAQEHYEQKYFEHALRS